MKSTSISTVRGYCTKDSRAIRMRAARFHAGTGSINAAHANSACDMDSYFRTRTYQNLRRKPNCSRTMVFLNSPRYQLLISGCSILFLPALPST